MKISNFNKIIGVSLILIIVLSIQIINYFVNDTKETNTVITYENNAVNKKKIDYSSFKEINLDKADIQIYFEGSKLNLSLPVYTKGNRYFLPFTEIIDKINGEYNDEGRKINIQVNSNLTVIDKDQNAFLKYGSIQKLKKNMYISGEIVYLSMFDITKILDLKSQWDYENKSISFFFNKDKLVQKGKPKVEKNALLRLEDVVASTVYRYGNSETLEKLRIISDFLYSKNVPFHIAWIPRYIDPRPNSKDDNDLANNYSIYNCDFVYTLDYMISRGGIIGLHGYTHQYGKIASVDGNEFHAFTGDGIPDTEEYVKERIKLSIESANKLDIPYSFFEAPHYKITLEGLKIAEIYFDYIYHRYPGVYNNMYAISRNGRTIRYIPTPLDYLDGKGQLKNMISKINNIRPGVLASFFFHPNIEFDDIKIHSDSNGYNYYEYSELSALHQLVKAFEENGYKFIYIQDLK